MWILSILPDWAIHLIATAGVIGVVASFTLGFVPLIKQHILPIKVISLLLLAVGLYLEGGLSNEKKWQFQVKEMEAKMAELALKASEKNIKIQTKIVEKNKIIKEKGDDIIKFVDREVVKKEEIIKYIEKCPVPKDIIDLHNRAVDISNSSSNPAESKK